MNRRLVPLLYFILMAVFACCFPKTEWKLYHFLAERFTEATLIKWFYIICRLLIVLYFFGQILTLKIKRVSWFSIIKRIGCSLALFVIVYFVISGLHPAEKIDLFRFLFLIGFVVGFIRYYFVTNKINKIGYIVAFCIIPFIREIIHGHLDVRSWAWGGI
jgi:hypothetical protein